MTEWSAEQYLKFEDERTRPVRDLINAIPLFSPSFIVDIGCGPGNSTKALQLRWPSALVSGFDSSPAMLKEARKRLPEVSFTEEKIENWTPPAEADLLFSNAVFQWLPNHIEEMQRLVDAMKMGAAFAVQMPDNLREPSHQAMIEVAQDARWCARIGDTARDALPNVSVYYDAFSPLIRHIDIWHSFYHHVMDNHEAIVEWVKGAALKPFLLKLNDSERADFLADYLVKIKQSYPQQADGKILLRFPRLFMVLVK